MNKEEKQAIEFWKKLLNNNSLNFSDYEKSTLQSILNLIEKQAKEIEAYKYIENQLIPITECDYWNYENHTCTHTCRECNCLNENYRMSNTGLLVDQDRYCRLYENENSKKHVHVEDLINRHFKGIEND